MDSARVRIVRKCCAPKTFPCPQCGVLGRRKDTHTRQIRDIAYRQVVFIEVTVGEYRAACACCKTFRSHLDGIEPRAEYTNRVREAVIDRLLDDGMNLERIREALHRDFLLDLSDGFLYDCLDWKVRQTDMPAQISTSADQQSRRANQSPPAILGKGALQVAAAADHCPLRRPGSGSMAETA